MRDHRLSYSNRVDPSERPRVPIRRRIRSPGSAPGWRLSGPGTDRLAHLRNDHRSPERPRGAPDATAPADADDDTARRVPAPGWVPRDDAIGRRPPRQVLVVGDTVVGRTLALLLRRAGYDPLLVAGDDRPVGSRVACLWPPALQVLGSLDVGTPVLERGVAIDGVSVRQADARPESATVLRDPGGTDVPSVLVGTRDLRRALQARAPDRAHGGDRTVETLTNRDGGLAVEFDDGIREWFDVVVDATGGDGTLRSRHGEAPDSTTLTQYEMPVDADVPGRNLLRDVWHSDALVQRAPDPNGSGQFLRVTTPASARSATLDEIRAETPSDRVAAAETDPAPDDGESTRVRQVTLPAADGAREWWGRGCVAFCGAAACPVAPASGCRVSLGIEGALAFVSELTRGSRPVAEAVDDYAARRARRLATLRRAVADVRADGEYPVPTRSPPASLAAVGALRTVALGPFLGETAAALQRDGFA